MTTTSPAELRQDMLRPYLGLRSFTEDDHFRFKGRASETRDLLRLVKREALTVLFGRSGLGKTSLLRAGLFPELRSMGMAPVWLRLHYRDELAAQVRASFEKAGNDGLRLEREQGYRARRGETLWEYFHTVALVDPRGRRLRPVLVFDQFEEIFTLGRGSRDLVEPFLVELADLVENRIPEALGAPLQPKDAGSQEQEEEADLPLTHGTPAAKVILALREEYLPHLDDLRGRMPSLATNRYRLKPMNGARAQEAVLWPGKAVIDEPVALEVVRYVADEAADTKRPLDAWNVEPALLSLVCEQVNERRLVRDPRGGAPISAELLRKEVDKDTVLDRFYDELTRDVGNRIRAFIERELLTEEGYRKQVHLADAERKYHLSHAKMMRLGELRLLRFEKRIERGVEHDYVEIIHDVMTRVISKRRVRRQRNRVLLTAGLVVLAVAIVAGGGAFWLASVNSRREAGHRNMTDLLESARQQSLEGNVTSPLRIMRRPAREAADEIGEHPPELELLTTRLLHAVAGIRATHDAGAGDIRAIRVGPKKGLLAAVNDNGTVTLWRDLRAEEPKPLILDPRAGLPAMDDDAGAPAPSGDAGAPARTEKDPEVVTVLADAAIEASIAGVAFSERGDLLAGWSDDGSVVVWDTREGTALAAIRTAVRHPHLVFGAGGRWLVIWNSEGGAAVELDRSEGASLAVRASMRIALPASANKTAGDAPPARYRVGEIDEVAFVPGTEARLAAVISDGRILRYALSGDARRSAVVREPDAGVAGPIEPAVLRGAGAHVDAVAVSGALAAVATSDQKVRVFRLDADKLETPEHEAVTEEPLERIVLDAEGTRVAGIGRERSVWVWDLAAGGSATPPELLGHDARIVNAWFGRDPSLVFTRDGAGALQMWKHGKPVRHWPLSRGPAFNSPPAEVDATEGLAYASDGGLLRILGLDLGPERERILSLGAWGPPSRVLRPPDLTREWMMETAVGFMLDGGGIVVASRDPLGEPSPESPQPASAGPGVWRVVTDEPLDTVMAGGRHALGIGRYGGSAYLWNLDDPSKPRRLPLSDLGDKHRAALSPDGTWLAKSPQRNSVCLYRTDQTQSAALPKPKPGAASRTPKPTRDASAAKGDLVVDRCMEMKDSVQALVFDATSRWVAAGDRGGTVKAFALDPDQKDPIHEWNLPGSPIESLALAPGGGALLAITDSHTVHLLEGRGAKVLAHPLGAYTASFAPGGSAIVTDGLDGKLRVFEKSGALRCADVEGSRTSLPVAQGLLASRDPGRAPRNLTLDGKGELILSYDTRVPYTTTVRLWDAGTCASLGRVGEANLAAGFVAGRRLATVSRAGTVRLWGVPASLGGGDGSAHAGTIEAGAFAGKDLLLTRDDAGGLGAWRYGASGAPSADDLNGHLRGRVRPGLSRGGPWVAAAGDDGAVMLWKDDGTRRVATLPVDGTLRAAVLDLDGSRLWTVDRATGALHVRAWPVPDLGPPGPVMTLADDKDEGENLLAAAASSGGLRIVTTTPKGRVRVWDEHPKRLVDVIPEQKGRISIAVVAPEGERVLIGTANGALCLWRIPEGRCEVLPRHYDGVTAAAFHPTGQLVVTGSRDKTVRFWSPGAATTERVHVAPIASLAFSEQGDLLLSADTGGTLVVWSTLTRKPVWKRVWGHHGAVRFVGFTPRGDQAISAGEDGWIRIWDTRFSPRSRDEVNDAQRQFELWLPKADR